MEPFSFMPIANTTHVEPGKYRATCTNIYPPDLFRAFKRWYMRVEFTIHEDGSTVSKYVNLGNGEKPSLLLTPRTDYYKLWTLAVGRKPEANEPMDSARIKGAEFLVTVVSKQKHGGGDYSVVSEVCEPERLSNGGTYSLLSTQDSLLNAQLLNAQDSVTQASSAQDTQPLKRSGSTDDFLADSLEDNPKGTEYVTGDSSAQVHFTPEQLAAKAKMAAIRNKLAA